jgi:hypothetical protein
MKLSLYIETSVIGAVLDNGDPFRRDHHHPVVGTRAFGI